MRGRWLAWVAGAVKLLCAASALACPAIPRTYRLDGVAPGPNNIRVPLNVPIFVPLVRAPLDARYTGTLVSNAHPLTELGSQTAVEVTLRDFGPPDDGVLSFIPLAALKPNTTYAVDLGDPPLQAADAGPAPSPTWQFTTGDALRPPLRLKGELSVTFEPGTAPVFECPPTPPVCGNPCMQTGEKNVTSARVQLPAGFDGFSDLHIEAELVVHEHLPNGQSGAVIAYSQPTVVAGETSETVVNMPMRDDGAAYAPCFDFTLTDARGDGVKTSLCLDTFPLPEGSVDTIAAAGGESSTTDTKTSKHTSSACSLGPPRPGLDSSLAALALALALIGRRNRTGAAPRRARAPGC